MIFRFQVYEIRYVNEALALTLRLDFEYRSWLVIRGSRALIFAHSGILNGYPLRVWFSTRIPKQDPLA